MKHFITDYKVGRNYFKYSPVRAVWYAIRWVMWEYHYQRHIP